MVESLHQRLTALEAFLREQYGGRFTVEPTTVSVGTGLTKVVDNDFERMALTFINIGANDVYITPSRDAADGKGVLLGATGGFLSLTARDDLVLVGWSWFGVAHTAASNVLIFPVKRYTP